MKIHKSFIQLIICTLLSVVLVPWRAESALTTTWEIVAGTDEFSDEEWYIIAPTLPAKGELDTIMDLSVFLRPFVAYDNGVLVAGATTFGQIPIGPKNPKTNYQQIWTANMGPRDVMLRVDENVTWKLENINNPQTGLSLPGYIGGGGAGDMDGVPPELRDSITKAISKSGPYTLLTGSDADLLVTQFLTGSRVILRRQQEKMYAGMLNYTETKTFSVGTCLQEAFARIGLRKNSASGKWELDPEKAPARKALQERAKSASTSN